MCSSPAVTIRRSDYRPPDHLVDQVELRFALHEETTLVTARLHLRRSVPTEAAPLILYGNGLELLALRLDGKALAPEEYQLDGERLIISQVPAQCLLDIETAIHPAANTACEGLYLSSGRFCTQCEAQGFRRITFYPDRPDVLARFSVTLVADRQRYPLLLSNGNPTESGELEDGLHFVRWIDPFPKPAYLFALVAGDLACLSDHFVTRSGRDVELRIYTEERNRDQCDHALRSLQQAMRWDEEVFGLEYDLDIYMIVAVDDFNMGAMENKGLNIFNSRYVLASPATATDADFQAIHEVIGHEYFHNWTGNRVTCRDWFQLSLKEGLTVFRDQLFSADHGSAAVKRIQDVRTLRASQFAEDAGPMAHPVRPDSYQEINNFYTATVYNKGAEVIRMYRTLLGPETFVRGVRLYLEQHDGKAVTIDDFLQAMAAVSGRDLTHFGRWYDQSGTPTITVSRCYDAATRTLSLTLGQQTAPTADQPVKAPLHIPVALGLLGPDGSDLIGTTLVELQTAAQTVSFQDVPPGTVPSLLRGFSAPVRVQDDLSASERAFLLACDSDPFCRWEAGQQLFTDLLLDLAANPERARCPLPEAHTAAFRQVLLDEAGDPALRALALTLPTVTVLAELRTPSDPPLLHTTREALRSSLAQPLATELHAIWERSVLPGPYTPEGAAVGLRSLKNTALAYLTTVDREHATRLCRLQLQQANNMTDRLAALTLLVDADLAGATEALALFHDRWQHEPLVLDKWFTLQATAGHDRAFDEVLRLTTHPDFNRRNPNRVRSLLGAFAHANPGRFHRKDGAGYEFIADQVLELDRSNPQIAARLVAALSRWQPLAEPYRAGMHRALERIAATTTLSRDVGEIVAKSLKES